MGLIERYKAFKQKDRRAAKAKLKKIFYGMHLTDGLFYKIAIYTLLISFSYVYLYPVLFMFVNSFKTVQDLIDPGVKWIPTTIEIENYQRALEVLQLPQSIYQTFGYVLKVSILATGSSALIGYGFAKFNFPFKRILFALMLATFILPPQVTMVSNMIIFRDLGIMSSQGSMTYPAFLGQGLNQSIFILIFYQFFKTIPHVLMESAEIDGASHIKIFLRIALPSAIPSIVIVFLFSMVWYWNETFMTALYVGETVTLPLKLDQFVASYELLYPPGTLGAELNEAIRLAGNMLSILPLMVLYFIGQRQFTESIDRTGITGE
jgi:multiple sugar transport system permease protein